MSINEVSNLQFSCEEDEFVPIYIGSTSSYQFYCPILNGTSFLEVHFNMNTTYPWAFADDFVLFSYLSLFVFCTYAGIKWINHLKR